MTPEIYVERLLNISHKKIKVLQEVHTLTKRQSGSITADTLDSLQTIINLKQSDIDRIDKLDEEFNVYFLRLKQQLGIQSLDELQSPNIKGIKELKDTIAGIMELIKEISTIEQQNDEKAKALLDELGKEIRKINQGKKATNAYNPGRAIVPPSYFIDKKE